jgi:glycerophosphoryl diester phosphodiesterase
MQRPSRFLNIGHRGASGACPENTLAAFRKAIDLGADMVELDCQLTRDGEVVVIHDEALDRTTSGRGPVSERTLTEIRALDAGSWFSRAFAGERVPTLVEVVECLRGKVTLNLEMKGDADPGRLEVQCLGILRSLRFFEATVFSSFSARRVRMLRELSAEARIGVLIEDPSGWPAALALAAELGAEALHPERRLAKPPAVTEAHAHGLELRVWPVNRTAEMESLFAMGVDGIFTDHPDRLALVRRSHEKGGGPGTE